MGLLEPNFNFPDCSSKSFDLIDFINSSPFVIESKFIHKKKSNLLLICNLFYGIKLGHKQNGDSHGYLLYSEFTSREKRSGWTMKESILNGKWVLGVNNDPNVLKHLEEKIEEAAPSCHFERATTYKDAFEHLVFFMYDLVILDSTLHRSRELLDFAVKRPFPVPVAIVTSRSAFPEALKLTKESGAKAILTKEELKDLIPTLEYTLWYESLPPLLRAIENFRVFLNARLFSSENKRLETIPYLVPKNLKNILYFFPISLLQHPEIQLSIDMVTEFEEACFLI